MDVNEMKIRTDECKYDLVALGEVMLRFDPGENRIRNARSFQVWEGGGEYNVSKGLHSCFRKNTAIVTALVENEIGKLLLGLIKEGGTNTSLINWLEDDGIGRSARNGVYYLEKGFGVRASLGASDRSNTAISKMKPDDIDWEDLFCNQGVKWFHTGGIYGGLSDIAPEVILTAAKVAKKYGTIISYDLNYRPSLWQDKGGKTAADEVNARILDHVDVLFGVDSLDGKPDSLDFNIFEKGIQKMANRHQNLKIIASTVRIVKNANINDWSGLVWANGKIYRGMCFPDLAIYDRVGGGDAFASGLICGFLENKSCLESINYAVVHGALTMSTPGDNSMVSRNEVERFIHSRDASVSR
jgi:2-dehydro-3-deoxygluconokinase